MLESKKSMQELTNKTKDLVDRWQAATKQLDYMRDNLVKAERSLQTAEENLAMWLLPEDAKEGEQFCIWYGDSLISATELPGDDGYEITTRKRGESLIV